MSTVLGVSSHAALARLDDPTGARAAHLTGEGGGHVLGGPELEAVPCVSCGEDASPQSGEIGYSFLKVEGVASFP